jgi:hypothetical protein
MAGKWQIERDIGNNPCGPVAEHEHTLSQTKRPLDIMGDQESCKLLVLPQFKKFSLHGHSRKAVEISKRLVHQQHRWRT